MKLSVVIPVFNAELFIDDTLLKLIKWEECLDYKAEVLLINDGSTDKTKIIIENYIKKNSFLKLITYSTNQGKGFAVKKGMIEAQGDFRIFTDADLPYGLTVFNKILYYLDFKEFDICIGNRKSTESKNVIKMDFPRKISSKLFTILISRYVVTGVGDTQCGLKGFRGEIAKKIFCKLHVKGFAFDVEVLYLSYKYELDIKRIPVIFQGNHISTINLIYSSINMLLDVLYLPIRYHLLKKY